jgi:protein gp37
MGAHTSIEWTDASWPIVNGCRRVSAGCENCYAERLTATRLRHTPKYASLAHMRNGKPRWSGESRLWLPHLDWPLRWTKPRKVFVADMGDLFYEGVSNEDIAAVFGVMAACYQHTFQVLTKRPERMRAWFRWYEGESGAGCSPYAGAVEATNRGVDIDALGLADERWPLPNVWLGVSVEDQATADERIPWLLETPAALRFVSAEPLLGEIDFERVPLDPSRPDTLRGIYNPLVGGGAETETPWRIDWTIVGGESGPGARRFECDWARRIIRQCRKAGVPCFVKQLGLRASDPVNGVAGAGLSIPAEAAALVALRLRDRKGGDMGEWPFDLRVRQFPEVLA